MLLTVLTWMHVTVAVVLVFLVLFQDPKGGGANGVFGGGSSSNSLFGSTGATNFLTQMTKGTAVLFAVLCIALTYVISHNRGSVLDNTPTTIDTAPASPTTPATETPIAPTETPTEPKAQ